MTAEFVHHQDSLTQCLVIELARVREQLYQSLLHLAAYTTEFRADERYIGAPLPALRRLPDVGGYVPARGPLITIDPPRYSRQGADAEFFWTDRVPLPRDQHSIGHRAARWHDFRE